jgi:hypothetical protein
MDELAKEICVTPTGVAIPWATRHPANLPVVLGTTKPERVREKRGRFGCYRPEGPHLSTAKTEGRMKREVSAGMLLLGATLLFVSSLSFGGPAMALTTTSTDPHSTRCHARSAFVIGIGCMTTPPLKCAAPKKWTVVIVSPLPPDRYWQCK